MSLHVVLLIRALLLLLEGSLVRVLHGAVVRRRVVLLRGASLRLSCKWLELIMLLPPPLELALLLALLELALLELALLLARVFNGSVIIILGGG